MSTCCCRFEGACGAAWLGPLAQPFARVHPRGRPRTVGKHSTLPQVKTELGARMQLDVFEPLAVWNAAYNSIVVSCAPCALCSATPALAAGPAPNVARHPAHHHHTHRTCSKCT